MTFLIYLSLGFFTIFGSTNGEPIREITGRITGTVHDNTPDSGLPYYGYPAGSNAAVGTPERYPTSSGHGNAGNTYAGTGQGNTRESGLPQPQYNPAGNNAGGFSQSVNTGGFSGTRTLAQYPTSGQGNAGNTYAGTAQGNTKVSGLPQPQYNPAGNNAGGFSQGVNTGGFSGTPTLVQYPTSGQGNAGNTYAGTGQGNIRESSLQQPQYNPAGNNANGFSQGANTGGFSGYPTSGHGNGGYVSNGKPINDIYGNVNGDVIDNSRTG